MNERLSISEIIDLFAKEQHLARKEAEQFVKILFDVIVDALAADQYVKIKNFGTFKLTEVSPRESVDVNTGERIEISSHRKVSFTPDTKLRDLINKPFAHFETVVIHETTRLADVEKVPSASETEEPDWVKQEKDSDEEQPERMDDALLISEKKAVTATLDHPKKKTYLRVILVGILLSIAGIAAWHFFPNGKKTLPVSIRILPAEHIVGNETDMAVGASFTDSSKLVSLPAETKNTENTTTNLRSSAVKPMGESIADTTDYLITGLKITYTLNEGETLAKVAYKYYGDKKLWPYIAKYNEQLLQNVHRVLPGMTLRIPELRPKR